jgi:hypothetical protein
LGPAEPGGAATTSLNRGGSSEPFGPFLPRGVQLT